MACYTTIQEGNPLKTLEQAKSTLIEALDYMRHSVERAKETGQPHLAIVSKYSDGSGKIIAKFQCEEFFNDLALVLGVGELTEEARLNASAVEFLHVHGIKNK